MAQFLAKFIGWDKTHNMLALVLDSRYKRLFCIIEFIARDGVIVLASDCSIEVLLQMLVMATLFLNLDMATSAFAQTTTATKSLLKILFL